MNSLFVWVLARVRHKLGSEHVEKLNEAVDRTAGRKKDPFQCHHLEFVVSSTPPHNRYLPTLVLRTP